MKKFLVFAAMFAAAFMTVSCGGSSITGDGYYTDGGKVCSDYSYDGDCKGHDVRACAEGDDIWYEVEGTGKKFKCDDGDCTKAAFELNNYCYDTNIDYDDDGTWCNTVEGEDSNCNGKKVKYCQKDDEIWYEVDDQIFKCDTNNENDCTDAFLKLGEYCAEAEEGNEGGESTFTDKATAYLPEAYADKTLAAWYSLTEEEKDKIKIEAIFLFDDNTLIKTTSKVYSVEDGREPSDERDATGEFTITSGDYENGEAHVVLELEEEMEFDVTISNGVLSAMGAEFTKQDNADVPEAR